MTVVPTPRTAHTYAYEALRSRIMSGELPPGAPLIQHSLADELGVSMTPVREALRDLATEGLITISPHRGATVTQLDFQDASEVYRIRLLLEPTAAMLAVPDASVQLLDRADELIREMAAVSGPEWVGLNLEFHTLLLSPLKSPRLLSILRSLQEAATLYVGVAIGQRVAMPSPESEHVAILDAYRRRDAAGAAAAVAEHLRSSLKALEPVHNHDG